jgi:hypothetical protein
MKKSSMEKVKQKNSFLAIGKNTGASNLYEGVLINDPDTN